MAESSKIVLTRIEEQLKFINEKLDKTIEQTTKTNGRVTTLEHWKSRIKGGSWVIGIFWVVLIAIIEFFAHK